MVTEIFTSVAQHKFLMSVSMAWVICKKKFCHVYTSHCSSCLF